MGQLDKTFDTLTGLHLMMDHASGGNTTLTAVAAKGASTVNVTAATSFAVGDDIRIGSGETMEMARIGGIASLEFTLEKPLLFDHDDTEAVVEMASISLGAPEADGVKITIPAEANDVFSAIQRSAYGTMIGYVDLGILWRFMAITADILMKN